MFIPSLTLLKFFSLALQKQRFKVLWKTYLLWLHFKHARKNVRMLNYALFTVSGLRKRENDEKNQSNRFWEKKINARSGAVLHLKECVQVFLEAGLLLRRSSTAGCLLLKQHDGRKALNEIKTANAAWTSAVALLRCLIYIQVLSEVAVIKMCCFHPWTNCEGGGGAKWKEKPRGASSLLTNTQQQ